MAMRGAVDIVSIVDESDQIGDNPSSLMRFTSSSYGL